MSIAHSFDKALLIEIKKTLLSSSFLVNVSDNGSLSWAMIGEADFIIIIERKVIVIKMAKPNPYLL